MKELSIIIPAFNEEDRLPLTLQRIFEYLAVHYQGEFEVIVVNDGSTDRTVSIVQQYQKNNSELKLLNLEQNYGRGEAVRRGVFESSGEYVLETDADGSVNEHAIVDFLGHFKRQPELDMLTGSRTLKGSRVLTPQPILRKFLGYSFFFLTKIFFGWPVMDRINGFKMYRREAALDIFSFCYEKGFLAKAEIVFIAEKRGWRVKELPILWTEYSGSKVRPIRDSFDSLVGLFRILARDREQKYSANKKSRKDTEFVKTKNSIEFESVLITGGAGFIGSNFVRYFYHKYPSSRIVNLDLLTYAGNRENLSDIDEIESLKSGDEKRYEFVEGDIRDEKLLNELFLKHKFDLVVHFAAESHVDRSIVSVIDFVQTNIEGTRALIEASRKHDVKKFVHISTDEVYGSVEHGVADEGYSLSPSNPYSASKAGADLLVQAYIKTHSFPAVIVRGSNNYGPYQYPEKLIPIAITNLLEEKKIPVHGYGVHARSWLHVEDFCRAIDQLAHSNPRRKIYNVSGDEKTNMEVIEAIAKALNMDLKNWRFHVDDRPGSDLRYAPDSALLKSEFNWTHTKLDFDTHIQEVVKWYVQNSGWWKKLRSKQGFIEHYERQSKGQWS